MERVFASDKSGGDEVLAADEKTNLDVKDKHSKFYRKQEVCGDEANCHQDQEVSVNGGKDPLSYISSHGETASAPLSKNKQKKVSRV